MATNECPLCHQPLPKGVHQHELDGQLKKLSSPFLSAERKKLREEYDEQLVAARETAKKQAAQESRRKLQEANERAQKAEREKREIANKIRKSAREQAEREVRKQFEEKVRKEVAEAVRSSTEGSAAKLEKLEHERQKEKVRHATEAARLQGQLQDLTRRLEARSGERIGNEAEMDLYTELRREYPQDQIDRIGRGVKGADIIHHVMDGTREAGLIIYESKDTLEWSHGWIGKAKEYRKQYETPHVMVVSRVFPGKQKGFCIEKGIPVVEKAMAIALAAVIREAVIEIAELKVSDSVRDERSQELFDYIVGDKFVTRFRDIAEGVTSLRTQQQKERTFHENAWEAESKIHARIEGCHREVGAQIRAIVREGKELELAAKA